MVGGKSMKAYEIKVALSPDVNLVYVPRVVYLRFYRQNVIFRYHSYRVDWDI